MNRKWGMYFSNDWFSWLDFSTGSGPNGSVPVPTNAPKRLSAARTDEATLEAISVFCTQMKASNWQERQIGISEMVKMAESRPSAVANNITKVTVWPLAAFFSPCAAFFIQVSFFLTDFWQFHSMPEGLQFQDKPSCPAAYDTAHPSPTGQPVSSGEYACAEFVCQSLIQEQGHLRYSILSSGWAYELFRYCLLPLWFWIQKSCIRNFFYCDSRCSAPDSAHGAAGSSRECAYQARHGAKGVMYVGSSQIRSSWMPRVLIGCCYLCSFDQVLRRAGFPCENHPHACAATHVAPPQHCANQRHCAWSVREPPCGRQPAGQHVA